MLLMILSAGIITTCYAQSVHTDSIDYKMVYGMGLKADVTPIITYLDTVNPVTEKDVKFKSQFLSRFKYQTEESALPDGTDKDILSLYRNFETYWRKSMLRPDINRDGIFLNRLTKFLESLNKKQSFTNEPVTAENLEGAFRRFVDSKGLHATDFGKTGKFYDLLLWSTEVPEEYPVQLIDTAVRVTVYFMDDFVSLGWLEYVRMGASFPGGWATEEGLYCVRKGYDLSSEKFLINFLKHEAQHFADRGRYEKLPAHRLEYRAKLIELHFCEETLYKTLETFIRTAKDDPSNAHPFANHHIVRNLSEKIFSADFVTDLSRWEEVPGEDIQKAAQLLYLEDTALLPE